MSKIGIFYGSSGGNTKHVAKNIAKKLGVGDGDVHDVAKAGASDLTQYDALLFGSSTWGLGDLQDDWGDFIQTVDNADLSGKKVALFGCGDSQSYPDTFCNAVGTIYHAVKDKAAVVGFTETDGYSFDESEAVADGRFVGLIIDEDNESNLTDERIDRWVAQLKKALEV
ncbi:MAG: flavodoxin [Dysgonamonadaceae bacterium]|jgi:flavodoxin I|nr:flavodoxin [Dysgonamonadaceae bacterium]